MKDKHGKEEWKEQAKPNNTGDRMDEHNNNHKQERTNNTGDKMEEIIIKDKYGKEERKEQEC